MNGVILIAKLIWWLLIIGTVGVLFFSLWWSC